MYLTTFCNPPYKYIRCRIFGFWITIYIKKKEKEKAKIIKKSLYKKMGEEWVYDGGVSINVFCGVFSSITMYKKKKDFFEEVVLHIFLLFWYPFGKLSSGRNRRSTNNAISRFLQKRKI